MDARRLVLALLAALMVAAGAVVAVLKFSGINKQQSQTKDIVAAARPIGAGSRSAAGLANFIRASKCKGNTY